jgi:cell division transport system permease protein
MARRLDYYFRETASGLRRNGLVAFAAVSTVFISLFLFGSALLISEQTNLVIDLQTERVEVAVYLKDNISQADQQRLTQLVAHMPQVSDYRYESKHEAYIHFRKLFANQPGLTNNVRESALPASFRIKLRNPETDYEPVFARLNNQPGVEHVFDERSILKRLTDISNILRLGAFIASAVMLLSAVALIANTVRMAVFARRKEIGIMKLVGATSWFIRIPFLIEGLFEGLLGSALAIGVLAVLRQVTFNRLHDKITFLPIISSGALFSIVPILLAVGMAVSVLASFIAMRRFLDI